MANIFVLAAAVVSLQCQLALCALGGSRNVSRQWKTVFEASPEHTRRLQGSGNCQKVTLETKMNSAKGDFFSINSRVYASLQTLVEGGKEFILNFPGTNGNDAKLVKELLGSLPVQDEDVKVEGCEVSGADRANAQTQLTPPDGVAASVEEGQVLENAFANSNIMEVTKFERVVTAGNAVDGTPPIVAAGTAAATIKVLAVITTTCGTSTGLTTDQVQPAMFGTGGQSYKKRMEECAGPGNQVTIQGESYGPVEVCPTEKRDAGATLTAVREKLKAAGKYDSDTYIVILVPDSWMDAIGMGQLGGKISWVRASYYDKATMHLHEIGHNLYLHHAAKGTEEYGDQSSPMGYCCALRCYHSVHSWQLGFSTIQQEIDASDVGDNIVDVHIKEHALNRDSLVVVKSSNSEYYVLSFRGQEGFDSFLPDEFKNQLFIHKFSNMRNHKERELTYVEGSIQLGLGTGLPVDFGGGNHYKNNHKLGSTGLQVTWWSTTVESYAEGRVAHARICIGDGNSECGKNDGQVPTQRPTPAPETPVWTDYFTETQGSSVTNKAMMGVGCKDTYCSSIKTAHSQLILVDLEEKTSIPSTGDVSEMFCPAGAVVSRILCTGANCKSLSVECATVRGGTLDRTLSGLSETAWIPQTVSTTEEGTCPQGSIVTGVSCGGTNCAKLKLRCNQFEPNEVCETHDQCDSLGLECGYDGCGLACGTDGGGCAAPKSCLLAAGRCATVAVQSDWFNSGKDMPQTGIVATGLRCQDRYCGDVAVVSMGVSVDLQTTDKSGWISDNVGKRWPWNDEADANSADCPTGMVVTHIECRNKWCDDLKLTCAPPVGWTTDEVGEPWVGKDWFSEEEGFQDCPDGFGMTGLECMVSKGLFDGCLLKCGDYCDAKKIRCRQLVPSAIGAANTGIASNMQIEAAQEPSADCNEGCRAERMGVAGITGGANGAALSLSAVAFALFGLVIA